MIIDKLCAIWQEGSCILSGIAYDGKDSKGDVQWTGSANIKVERYFTATLTKHYIESFNVNTNKWVLR